MSGPRIGVWKPGLKSFRYACSPRPKRGVTHQRLAPICEPHANGNPGMNIVTKMHVEAHAAAIRRLDGLKTATLWLNRAPCAGITGCEHLLPRIVPQGSELLIHIVPNGGSANIVGTLLVEGVG